MREVTERVDLAGAADLYPGLSKVTVDEANGTAYVFTRGNRAQAVTGEAFDALVKVLPAATAGDDVAQEAASPDLAAPAGVEPVEAVISVVKEPDVAEGPVATSKRRKKES